MCGVFGYVGQPTQVIPLVADALRIMEYRGYDSWGIGWDTGSEVALLKRTGRVPTSLVQDNLATIAIGHTRWATHGGVTDTNAHPHSDESGQIAVVHNGVIENAELLKATYLAHVAFRSETDSEIVPHLIRWHMDHSDTFTDAVRKSFLLLEGSSAILAMDRSTTMMAAITARSPLRLGRRTDGWELASDPLACARSSQEIAVIPDHHLVVLTRDTAQMLDLASGSEVAISWEPTPEETETSRGTFPHFTIKEIHDQVQVTRDLATRHADVEPLAHAIQRHSHILLTGCGSAYYAATLGAQWLSQATNAWIDVVPASEVSPSTRSAGANTLVIALTQSGETADVVDAMQQAQTWGATTATVVNTETSTIANMADVVVGIKAGVERSVLATKSFMAMAMRLHQTARVLAGEPIAETTDLSSTLESILNDADIARIAKKIADNSSMLVLGNGFGRPIAQETALKIKEGSYLHAEAFSTGELKHGPLALVDEGVPCIVIATSRDELKRGVIAAAEVRSRGGYVIGVGEFPEGVCSETIRIDSSSDYACLLHLVAMQKLAYHIAIARGVDPDFPRNLAKSVTVR
ncbi:MAG: glutamine--fructose-6-phosphate transaminase (isomerizing) [Thermomicrobiales bacterium]|nr:glutamine--fructose-6-phosphate transaminase (isomerizing) [Thermomicrobiales bacterium]